MMKKVVSLIVMLSCFAGIFAAPKKSPSYTPIEIDYVTQEEGNIVFSVNPAVELLFIAARLAGYENFNRFYDSDYLNQIDTLFAKYKDSDFVTMLRKYKEDGLKDIALVELSYYLKPDFSGTTVPLKPVPEMLAMFWGYHTSSNEIYNFVKQLNEFAQKTNFQRIYLLNRSTYINFVSRTINDMQKEKIFDWAANYFEDGKLDKIYAEVSILSGYNYGDCIMKDGKLEKHMLMLPYYGVSTYSYVISQAYMSELASMLWPEIQENLLKFYYSYSVKYFGAKMEDLKKYHYNYFIFTQFIVDLPRYNYVYTMKPDMYESNVQAWKKAMMDENLYPLVDIFEDYAKDRRTWPTFRTLIPTIKKFVNELPEVK